MTVVVPTLNGTATLPADIKTVAVLQFDNAAGRLEAGTEPRRSHAAMAVQR